MVLDHIKYAIPQTNHFITQYLGRMAFPLFAFLVGEGYCHTSNLKKYYQRLILFAIISQLPFMLFRTLVGQWKMLNILFTLLFGLVAITLWDKLSKKNGLSIHALILIMIGLLLFGRVINVDYGWYGILSVFVLYRLRDKKVIRILGFAILTGIYYYPRILVNASLSNFISYFCTVLPTILLLFYNGKLGKKTKYGYYIFYPAHMLLLYAISLI